MNCDKVSENMLSYLDHELSEERSIEFDKHLDKCLSCKILFEELSSTYQIIEVEKNIPIDPFFYHKLTTRLQNKKQEQSNNIFMNVLKPLAVAASIALGIIIGNGELDLLANQENDVILASENLGLVMPEDYSVWATINEEDGSED